MTIIIFWTSKNFCSMLWLSGGKGKGNPNKTAVSADTENNTEILELFKSKILNHNTRRQ